jgi:hypothetical protein
MNKSSGVWGVSIRITTPAFGDIANHLRRRFGEVGLRGLLIHSSSTTIMLGVDPPCSGIYPSGIASFFEILVGVKPYLDEF